MAVGFTVLNFFCCSYHTDLCPHIFLKVECATVWPSYFQNGSYYIKAVQKFTWMCTSWCDDQQCDKQKLHFLLFINKILKPYLPWTFLTGLFIFVTYVNSFLQVELYKPKASASQIGFLWLQLMRWSWKLMPNQHEVIQQYRSAFHFSFLITWQFFLKVSSLSKIKHFSRRIIDFLHTHWNISDICLK